MPLALLTLMIAWVLDDGVPVVSGIFPPGVTLGTREIWTITGRNLTSVRTVLATGAGLRFQPPILQPDGRSLTVEVAAQANATVGYRSVRVDGPAGISNLALVRLDRLSQVIEVEPNDRSPAPGQIVRVGTAVAGTIRPLDVDHFRVEGTPGQRVTLDWETRRLGTAIIPVMTITGPNEQAIRQARSSPGGDRDCRATVVVPPEGWFAVELRDNTYAGDDRARYRLRVDPLAAAFAPGELAPDASEPHPNGGVTIQGRINEPGEVDRYRVEAKRGDRFRARLEAAAAGSWLDSVVTVVGPQGERLGENDDRPAASTLEPPPTLDGSPTTDSEVDVTLAADGPLVVEVADRFGMGGPEYGYRLELGPPRPDFAIFVLRNPNSANLAAEALAATDERGAAALGPGAGGAFNLRPGSTTAVPFLVVPRGRPGSIEVRVEGLPEGVEAEPVAVRIAPAPRPGSKAAARWDAPPEVDSLQLRVRPDAKPGLGSVRVMARTLPGVEPPLERQATAVVGVDAAGGAERPVVWQISEWPVRVLAAPTP